MDTQSQDNIKKNNHISKAVLNSFCALFLRLVKIKWKFLMLKGIDRPFRGGVESILIRSLLVNWRLGYFFYLILKGLLHKISKKPLDDALC